MKKTVKVYRECYDNHGFRCREIIPQEYVTGRYREEEGRISVEVLVPCSFLWRKWVEMVWVSEDAIDFVESIEYDCREKL